MFGCWSCGCNSSGPWRPQKMGTCALQPTIFLDSVGHHFPCCLRGHHHDFAVRGVALTSDGKIMMVASQTTGEVVTYTVEEDGRLKGTGAHFLGPPGAATIATTRPAAEH